MKMALRSTAALFSLVVFATACTAVLGVDDVPDVPVADAGPTTQPDASNNNTETGPLTNPPDTGAPDTGPAVDPMKAAISAYAAAYCSKLRECERVLFDIQYADTAECEMARAAHPALVVDLPGSTVTAGQYEDCATKTQALTCATFASADLALACVIKGARKDGEKCIANEQCDSGVCASFKNTCRTCVPAPQSGTDCAANGACAPGLTCSDLGKCVVPAKLNASCGNAQPCDVDQGLECNGTKCIAQPAAAGASCAAVDCDLAKGFFCNDNGSTCVSVVVNGPGADCNESPAAGEQFAFCRRFATCGANNKCGALALENDPCTSDFNCLEPLSCIANKCQKSPGSSSCE